MERKHTPTPWGFRVEVGGFALRSNDGSVAIMGPDGDDPLGKRICLVDCQTPYKRGQGYATECEEREANRALIVRAVNSHADLLAALEEIVNSIERGHGGSLGPDDLASARAAIRKAKGE